ncbi:MAG TPA: DUF4412 domain-containing protein [Thermoanaerobaculia bacterium]
MRKLRRSIVALTLLAAAASPAFAGIHYKSTTRTEAPSAQPMVMQVEGWVSGPKAKIEFDEASGNPMVRKGAYLVTKNGGQTLYLVDPKEKTYAEWDLQAMLGFAGSVMNGMGPLLKVEFANLKTEKLLDEDGGAILGLPTKHYRFRTSYTMKMRVMGMANESDVVTDQDVWVTQKLQDAGLGAWLRSSPPRTGNEQFDKLINAEWSNIQGYPLKMVSVSTSTPKKKGQPTTTRTTMEVTQLDASATVADSAFEIPAGYEETQMMPAPGSEAGGFGGLFNKKKKDGGE